MKNFEEKLVTAAGAAALMTAVLLTAPSFAQEPFAVTGGATKTKTKVEWETEKKTVVPTGTRVINLDDFDENHDGIISRREVGDHMFKMYDTDGNEVIDNIEYERKAVMTVVPVEEKTKITYDFDGDGLADKETRTTRDFMEATRLAAFDGNGDGLSPHEFMQRRFNQADVNHDHAIDEAEWRGSYLPRVDARNKAKARFNK